MHTMKPNRTARPNRKPTADLLPASLASIALATAPYAVQITGNELGPTFRNGAYAHVTPAQRADPLTLDPGSFVLAALATPGRPNEFRQVALFRLNADGDISTNAGTVARGEFVILGVARPM